MVFDQDQDPIFRGLAAGWLQKFWDPLDPQTPKASPAQDAPDVHAASPQRSRRRPQGREVCLRLGPGRRWEHRGDHVWCRGPGRPGTGDDAGKTGCLLEGWIGTDNHGDIDIE